MAVHWRNDGRQRRGAGGRRRQQPCRDRGPGRAGHRAAGCGAGRADAADAWVGWRLSALPRPQACARRT